MKIIKNCIIMQILSFVKIIGNIRFCSANEMSIID